MGVLTQIGLGRQRLGILDHAHGDNRITPQMRADQDRLILVVADDPDPRGTMHVADVVVEFRAELGIGNVVDVTGEPVPVEDSHAAALCSQM